jgi:hypothetical protein
LTRHSAFFFQIKHSHQLSIKPISLSFKIQTLLISVYPSLLSFLLAAFSMSRLADSDSPVTRLINGDVSIAVPQGCLSDVCGLFSCRPALLAEDYIFQFRAPEQVFTPFCDRIKGHPIAHPIRQNFRVLFKGLAEELQFTTFLTELGLAEVNERLGHIYRDDLDGEIEGARR